MTTYKVHAPPDGKYGAFCRFINYPAIASRPSQVTCVACLRKMRYRRPDFGLWSRGIRWVTGQKS